MRLTLRTLLAYLDNTLSPENAKTLGEKVQHSSIASELADRIRRVTAQPTVDAPDADAVGPTDDANAIAEYLDDTLAPELTADVERRCVASDVQLSEVAACHQILAIVLGEKAEVPTTLRKRVYELGSQAAMAHPEQSSANQPANTPDSNTPPSPTADPTAEARDQVTPVGPADSGVADATTRMAAEPDLNATLSAATKQIRKQLHHQRGVDPNGQAIAGDRTRERLESIGPILAGGRPSRVAPLLVALGLAAAFLFVVTQAFSPLKDYRKRIAEAQDAKNNAPATNPAPQNISVPPTNEPNTPEIPSAETPTEPAPTNNNESTTSSPPDSSPAPVDGATADKADAPAPTDNPNAENPNNTSEPAAVNEPAPAPNPTPNTPTEPIPDNTQPNPLDAAVEQVAAAPPLGIVEVDGGMLLLQDSATGQWSRLSSDAELDTGDVLACGPTYSARLLLEGGLELNLIGPCAIRISEVASEAAPKVAKLSVDFGRLVLMATSDPLEVRVATPAISGRCELTAAGTACGISVAYRRPPGSNLLDPNSSVAITDLIAIQNRLEFQPNNQDASASPNTISLNTNQACRFSTDAPPQVNLAAEPPAWTGPDGEQLTSPQQLAQQGLAETLSPDDPIELGLRKLIGFRRQEVSALAARTLLHLGMVDVLFGPEGVLNTPQHRNQWPVLVGDLRAFVSRGQAPASLAGAAIGQLEGEQSGGKIWALLTGFTPEQLERGADNAILELMDDPAMSVRVVATETLRHITGDTLAFRPDYDTPTRRSKVLKELQRRQRRDQIRWTDPEAATRGLPTIDGNDQNPLQP